MVAGIAALLDDQHARIVEAIWQEFTQRFGVHGLSQTPIPHLTYHVAASYDTSTAVPQLRQIASQTPPFTIQTNGLGLFTGPEPVLYIHVRPSPHLDALHRRLWAALDGSAGLPSLLYSPENWQPHISLSYRDMGPDVLAQAVGLLCQRDFSWQVRIETLSIISAPPGAVHMVEWRVNLGG
jgi:2'-5' RNA ligase